MTEHAPSSTEKWSDKLTEAINSYGPRIQLRSYARNKCRHVASVHPRLPLDQIVHKDLQLTLSGISAVYATRHVRLWRGALLLSEVGGSQDAGGICCIEDHGHEIGVRGQALSRALDFSQIVKTLKWLGRQPWKNTGLSTLEGKTKQNNQTKQ